MSDEIAAALEIGDLNRVVDLYTEEAVNCEAAGAEDAACFLLTQAWIYALEAGDSRATDISARLIARGREVET